MTEAQRQWFNCNPNYEFIGPPRPDARYVKCGTLYSDGRFELMEPMKPIKLEYGCVAVGIAQ